MAKSEEPNSLPSKKVFLLLIIIEENPFEGEELKSREQFAISLRKSKKEEIIKNRRLKLGTKHKSSLDSASQLSGSDLEHPAI